MTPTLFDPISIAGRALRSRLFRSATAERLAMKSAEEARALGASYAAMARSGVGLIVTGHIAVDPSGKAGPAMPMLNDEASAGRWAQAFAAVHCEGGAVCPQLNHAGGRAKLEVVTQTAGARLFNGPVCVSPLPDRPKDPLDGQLLTDAMIESLVAAYAHAARLAQQAGADAVQIHAAHGYLGTQFLSPVSNRRSDRWGGTIENRARFLREVTRAIRAATGPGFPVGMKLGACDEDAAGLTLEDAVQCARWLQEEGLDFIEISGAFRPDIIARNVAPGKNEAYYLAYARRFKEALTIPVIAVGGFRSLKAMNAALESGACDAVAVSRPLIRQPDLLQALRAGRSADCVSCNRCLLQRDPGPTQCRAPKRPAPAA